MTDLGYSPAEHLDAVALSEANAWKDAVLLCAGRMRGGLNQQTDSRLFLLAVRLLLRAAALASDAVRSCPPAAQIVSEAQARFAAECPGVKDACDVVEHFREYAAGAGNLQVAGCGRPAQPSKAAADWPLGYDERTSQIRVGQLAVDVPAVCDQAKLLLHDIWLAVTTYDRAGRPGAWK